MDAFKEPLDLIVLGAGISGLMAAETLRRAHPTYRIGLVDKGRGFGGRMATRRFRNTRVDHGAQFFTARDPRFQSYITEWLKEGWIKKWFQHSPVDSDSKGHARYGGIQGISDLPKHLAASFPVRRETRIDRIERVGNLWRLLERGRCVASAPWVLLTAPLPQTIELLDASEVALPEGTQDSWRAVQYERGLAIMVELDQASTVPNQGAWPVTDSAVLSWIGDNQQKGISPEVPAITLHTTAEYAHQHWDSPDAVRCPPALEAAAPWLMGNIIHAEGHRWGYTRPINPLTDPTWLDDRGLAFAGDAFGGPRVEGSALSGIEAGSALVTKLSLGER